MSKSFEEESKCIWSKKSGTISDMHLAIGCLQRIGTALEKIGKTLKAVNETLEKNTVVLEKIEARMPEKLVITPPATQVTRPSRVFGN